MDPQLEMRRFLVACRARLAPERAGIPAFEGLRRVPGLRREEVAHLAGVSVDYYTRLERGRVAGVSESVLDSVARALQLDDVERDHLHHLAQALRGPSRERRADGRQRHVRPEIERVLDSITVPAFVQNRRLDVLAANELGWAIYSHAAPPEPPEFNHVEFEFLNPHARAFYPEWEQVVEDTVAILREAAARDGADETISQLIRHLSRESDCFRRLWSSMSDVRRLRRGRRRLAHPLVGELVLAFEAFELTSERGLILLVYTAADA